MLFGQDVRALAAEQIVAFAKVTIYKKYPAFALNSPFRILNIEGVWHA